MHILVLDVSPYIPGTTPPLPLIRGLLVVLFIALDGLYEGLMDTLYPPLPPLTLISPNDVSPPFLELTNVLLDTYAPLPPFPILIFIV